MENHSKICIIVVSIHYGMFQSRLFVFILFSFFLSTSVFSQKIVAFDKRGKVKRIKYYKGDFIRLKTIDNKLISGTISRIDERSFMVENKKVVLDSVRKVFNTQKFYGFKIFGTALVVAGTGYFGLDGFNRLINNDGPIIERQTIAYSAGLLGTGLIFNAIANKAYRISEKRPLKIIDLTI